MKTVNTTLLVVLFAALGVFGCAESPGVQNASAQIRHLKSRTVKLEEDYRATVAECVRLRKKLAATEEVTAQVTQERDLLQDAVRERDDLRQQASVYQAERDDLQGQLSRFGRELQSLAGKVEQATSARTGPPLASTVSMQTQR